MKTLKERINTLGITMDLEAGDVRDGWPSGSHHYRATLKLSRRRMTVPFSTGSAWTHDPEVADVLDYLISDASGYDGSGSFETWAAEYGYDPDSRKAEKIYKAVECQTDKLKQFLGVHYDDFINNTETL